MARSRVKDVGIGSGREEEVVPFEFVREITSACAMAKSGDIERRTATRRHVDVRIAFDALQIEEFF